MTENNEHAETVVSLRQSTEFETDPFDITFEDIHGLDEAVAKLRNVFVPSIADSDLSVRSPSVLIYGPEGSGMPRLGRAVVSNLTARDFRCVSVSAKALTDRDSHREHRADKELADLIDRLTQQTPVVLYITDFQQMQFGPDRHFQNAVAALRDTTNRLAIVCTLAQKHSYLEPEQASEYFGFADFLFRLDTSTHTRRAAVLSAELASMGSVTGSGELPDIEQAVTDASAAFDIGLVPDIARRVLLIANTGSTTAKITIEDVTTGIEQVTAEQSTDNADSRRLSQETPQFSPTVTSVTFDDIGGLDDEIQQIRQHLEYPRQYKEIYNDAAFTAPTGLLLHGPPGTGKTMLAKALANETERTFYAVEGGAIKSKWFGQSEQHLRTLFSTARENAPSLIFFDEFDALARRRQSTGHSAVRSIVNTLLAELDGLEGNEGVTVVAATNYLDAIDPAVRRQGRLGETIEITPPGEAGQRDIFRLYADSVPMAPEADADWFVANSPSSMTGATIASTIEQALRSALARSHDETPVPITRKDIRNALDATDDTQSFVGRSYR